MKRCQYPKRKKVPQAQKWDVLNNGHIKVNNGKGCITNFNRILGKVHRKNAAYATLCSSKIVSDQTIF